MICFVVKLAVLSILIAITSCSPVDEAKSVLTRIDAALIIAKSNSATQIQQDMTSMLANSHLVNVDFPMRITALHEEVLVAKSMTPSPNLPLAAQKKQEYEDMQKKSDDIVSTLTTDMNRYLHVFEYVDEAKKVQEQLLELVDTNIKNDLFIEAIEIQTQAEALRDKVIELTGTPFYQIAAAQLGDHAVVDSSSSSSTSSTNSQQQLCVISKARLIRDMEQTLAVREPQDISEAEVEYIALQAMQKKIDVELPAIIKVVEERAIEQRRLAHVAQSDASKYGIKENYDVAEKEKKKSEKHFADAAISEREVLTLQAELLTQKDELYDMTEALMETHNLRKRGKVEILRLAAAAVDASSRLEFTLARSFTDQKKLYESLSDRLEQTSIDIQVRLQKAEKVRLQKAAEKAEQVRLQKAEEVRLRNVAFAEMFPDMIILGSFLGLLLLVVYTTRANLLYIPLGLLGSFSAFLLVFVLNFFTKLHVCICYSVVVSILIKEDKENVRRKFGAILLFCSYYLFLQLGIWYVRKCNEGGSPGFFDWCATMCAALSLTAGMMEGLERLLSAN